MAHHKEATQSIFCMKCRVKTPAAHLEAVVMKNGKNATRGKCSICGTTVFTINKKS